VDRREIEIELELAFAELAMISVEEGGIDAEPFAPLKSRPAVTCNFGCRARRTV
jgi:hypothetical protein